MYTASVVLEACSNSMKIICMYILMHIEVHIEASPFLHIYTTSVFSEAPSNSSMKIILMLYRNMHWDFLLPSHIYTASVFLEAWSNSSVKIILMIYRNMHWGHLLPSHLYCQCIFRGLVQLICEDNLCIFTCVQRPSVRVNCSVFFH